MGSRPTSRWAGRCRADRLTTSTSPRADLLTEAIMSLMGYRDVVADARAASSSACTARLALSSPGFSPLRSVT